MDAQSLDVVIPLAVRLADEGVPLRAIARATRTPSDVIREQLKEAKTNGRLLAMPRDDWPPGFPSDQRALQLSRMVVADRDAVLRAAQHLFGFTPTEFDLLMTMLQHKILLKDQITDLTPNTVHVHVCHIRQRLEPFGIEIQTLWGLGYQFIPTERRKVMALILGSGLLSDETEHEHPA
jgi:DNA-binding response OmpR family regulator